MQDIINSAVLKLTKIIDSKQNSLKVAWQFILEELDAARNGNNFIQDRIKSFYIDSHDFIGAMNRSCSDVEEPGGPQQFLLNLTITLSKQVGVENAAEIRLSIVECIISHYNFGRFYVDRTFRTSKKPLDLFQPLSQDIKLHPHYKTLMTDEYKPVRDVISQWASGFEDRDSKLSKEFQTTFNSSFWEIYLYQCFKDLNFMTDFLKTGPDFCLKSINGEVFNVEAVTANHAHETEPEWSNNSVGSVDIKFA